MYKTIPTPTELKKEIDRSPYNIQIETQFNIMAENQINLIKNAMQHGKIETHYVGNNVSYNHYHYLSKEILKSILFMKGYTITDNGKITW